MSAEVRWLCPECGQAHTSPADEKWDRCPETGTPLRLDPIGEYEVHRYWCAEHGLVWRAHEPRLGVKCWCGAGTAHDVRPQADQQQVLL